MPIPQNFLIFLQLEIILKIQISNKSTEEEYINRLKIFNEFLYKKYDTLTIDTLLEKINLVNCFTTTTLLSDINTVV